MHSQLCFPSGDTPFLAIFRKGKGRLCKPLTGIQSVQDPLWMLQEILPDECRTGYAVWLELIWHWSLKVSKSLQCLWCGLHALKCWGLHTEGSWARCKPKRDSWSKDDLETPGGHPRERAEGLTETAVFPSEPLVPEALAKGPDPPTSAPDNMNKYSVSLTDNLCVEIGWWNSS